MTDFAEKGPKVPQTTPEIGTIDQAIEEIQRLHGVLGAQAVEHTVESYWSAIKDGEEGIDWRATTGLTTFRVPILGPIIRRGNELLLGPRYNAFNGLESHYTLGAGLARNWHKVPFEDALTIHRTGMGFRPDEQHLVVNEQILRGQYNWPRDLTPTAESVQRPVVAVPTGRLNGEHAPLTEVDSALLATINELRAYEILDPADYPQ
jgi:hypothetical protein